MSEQQNSLPPLGGVALEALNLIVEAHLSAVGPKEASRYMRACAALLTDPRFENVVNIRRGKRDADDAAAVREWLRDRLSVWLAKYG